MPMGPESQFQQRDISHTLILLFFSSYLQKYLQRLTLHESSVRYYEILSVKGLAEPLIDASAQGVSAC